MKGILLAAGILASIWATAQNELPKIPGWKQKDDGERTIYTPVSLIPSHFTYEVMPLTTGSGELDQWLQQAAEKNIASSGYAKPETKNTQSGKIQSFNIYTALLTDQAGKQWTMNYVAYRKPDGGIRFAKIAFPTGPNNPYLNTAIQHFLNLSKKEGIVLKAGNTDTNDHTAASGSSNSNSSRSTGTKSTKKETPVTAPGQGLKPAEIKGVVINQEYGFGVGGMMIVEYNPYLMLANGTVYKYPEVAPYDLDVAASKTAEPNKWGTWKLEGEILVVTLPEKGVMKTERWDHWFWTKVPQPSEKIKGAYTTIGGGGNTALGGSTMIVYSNTIHFNDKGQFTMQKMGGGSNSDFDVSTTAYSKSNAAGTYRLNGYSIEMKYNNGEVVRKLFYFYPDSRTTFGIGGSAYVPD